MSTPVHRPRFDPAPFRAAAPLPLVRSATLAAAAALGVMVGLGLRGVGSNGWTTALARLSVVALRLRGLPEFVAPDRHVGIPAAVGGLHVAAVAAGWGAVVAAASRVLARRHAAPRVAAAALVGTVLALAAADAVLPRGLRLAAGTLTAAEWALAVCAVGGAAWLGTRLTAP